MEKTYSRVLKNVGTVGVITLKNQKIWTEREIGNSAGVQNSNIYQAIFHNLPDHRLPEQRDSCLNSLKSFNSLI